MRLRNTKPDLEKIRFQTANGQKTQLFQKNLPIFLDSSELLRLANTPTSVLEAGGRPSTWPPPERLEKPFAHAPSFDLLFSFKFEKNKTKKSSLSFQPLNYARAHASA